ncbi:MAG: glycosyltransferase family 1 protein [Cyanobacteria bacterium J06649_4]
MTSHVTSTRTAISQGKALENKVYFYAPDARSHHFFDKQKLSWADIFEARQNHSGNFTSWILSTYLHLRKTGIDCEVIDHLPEQGIVLADRDTLGNRNAYLGKLMLICAKGDREFHPSAHLHVVHNPVDFKEKVQTPWSPHYIPHWPQPNLIPRAKSRGTLVENIAFIGSRSNLASEFYSEKWISALSSLGCQWTPLFASHQWCDYSKIDAVVAVRNFDNRDYEHKPASKLINCWHSSVPAILAPESAFLAIQKSELDFLTVRSLDETINAVKSLKNSPELYQAIVNNGNKRAQEITDATVTTYWESFFQDYVFPEYRRWVTASEATRFSSFSNRCLRLKADRLKSRLLHPFKQ